MESELDLKAEFHSALDAVLPPVPWLEATVNLELRKIHYDSQQAVRIASRRRAATVYPSWIVPAVAALLTVAIVGTLLLAAHALHYTPPVPARTGPSGSSCQAYGQLPFWWAFNVQPGSPQPPVPARMVGGSTAWAEGGLRTADGGLQWRDFSPPALRDGLPANARVNDWYPPGFSDFYLDSSHAWESRTYSSTASCNDHFVVFTTSNGGQSWQQSDPVALGFSSEIVDSQLDFVDSQTGWLWILNGAPGNEGGQLQNAGKLYGTSDGGLHWRLVANFNPQQVYAMEGGTYPDNACWDAAILGEVTFATRAVGWIGINCPTTRLLETRDGGRTWKVQNLPAHAGLPIVFDANHWIVQTDQGLLTTRDGGATWQSPGVTPGGLSFKTLYFSDSETFFGVVDAAPTITTSWLYQSTDGGRTWKQVSGDIPIERVVAIVFGDSQHGLMLGAVRTSAAQSKPVAFRYVLLASSDGGHTWKNISPQVS